MHNGFLISVSKASILIQELLCPINLLLTLNTSSPLPVFGYHFQLSDAVRRNTLQETEVQRHPRDRTESAKCQACPRENEAMHCGVVSRKKCKKLLAFLQFFHLQDVSSEQSYHCITAQMKIQEQLLDSHTGSQLLHQNKTARGFSLNQRDAGTAALKPHFCSQNITHLIQDTNDFCKFQFSKYVVLYHRRPSRNFCKDLGDTHLQSKFLKGKN